MGWDRDELWHGIIDDGLRGYRKKEDVGYWLSRETCDLILRIDRDIDEHEEDIRNGKSKVD